jgi:hypothetical protein
MFDTVRRIGVQLALIIACAAPGWSQTNGPPCCDAAQVATIRDLNYLARVRLGQQGPIVARLYAMNQAISAADYTSFRDTDRGELLGYMTATPDGTYWRPLLEAFASRLGVSIKPVGSIPVTPPAPPPAPVPPPPSPVPPPPPSSGAIEAAIRAAVRDEIAALQAQVTGLASRVAVLEKAGGSSSPGTAVFDGDVIFRGRVGFGGFDEQFGSKVHFVGNGYAMPVYVSNTDGAQYQNSSKHVAEIGLAPDGGVGMNQNAATLAGAPWQEIDTDEAGWELWRPGMKWIFAIDAKYGPALFFKPVDFRQ